MHIPEAIVMLCFVRIKMLEHVSSTLSSNRDLSHADYMGHTHCLVTNQKVSKASYQSKSESANYTTTATTNQGWGIRKEQLLHQPHTGGDEVGLKEIGRSGEVLKR